MKKKAKPVRMFAVKSGQDVILYVSYQARLCRIEIGGLYQKKDWRKGWKEAKKRGYRVVPVIVQGVEK